MIKSKKSLAFCLSLTFISSIQAVKSTKVKTTNKTKSDDRITQLIIANHICNSFKEYEKCDIEYHSEIDTDTNETLSILETKIKVPKTIERLKFPSGTQTFRYKLLRAYNEAKKQKRLRKDSQRLLVDSYTSLRIKKRKESLSSLLNIASEKELPEEESTQKKKEPTVTEMTGITIMPQSVYKEIKDRWTPKPPAGFYT